MGARQKDWARRVREALFDELGRSCAWCGARSEEVKLTFDCIIPTREGHKSDHHRRYDWSWRMSFYRAMHAAKNLQVLCDSCNSKKGDNISFHETELPDVDLPPLVLAKDSPF